MPIDLVVFDMAGTTLHDDDAVHRCLQDALAAGGVSVSRDDVNAVMGMPKPLAIEVLVEGVRGASASSAEVAALYGDFEGRMLRHYRESPEVRETGDASAVFRELRSMRVKVALDTGFNRVIADAIIDRLAWRPLIDASVASDEVPHGRPHPDMIFRAMGLTGVDRAEHVAKVGDTPADLKQGHLAGCWFVIGITSGSHTRAELAPHFHTHLVPSIVEVPALIAAEQRRAAALAGA